MKHSASRRAQAGMSMIELLAAVLLISFGILGLLSLVSRATQASVGSEDNLRAAMIANELATVMWNAGTANLSATTVANWSTARADAAQNPLGGLPNGNVSSSFSGGVARVTVRWTTTGNVPHQYQTDVIVNP